MQNILFSQMKQRTVVTANEFSGSVKFALMYLFCFVIEIVREDSKRFI